MSHPNPPETCDKPRFVLARLSLLFVSMPWLHAGCLVPEPEKFREPLRTAPILNLDQAAPPINTLINIPRSPASTREFTIGFRSEDRGERVLGLLYVDYGTPSEDLKYTQYRDPSTLDDERERKFQLSPTFEFICNSETVACCHRATFLAMHESSATTEGGAFKPDPVLSGGDLAMATWWIAVGSTSVLRIDDCPGTGLIP